MPAASPVVNICARCHAAIVPEGIGTGYAELPESQARICYACLGTLDALEMASLGAATLYLDGPSQSVTNWPGTLRLVIRRSRTSRTPFGGRRTDVWFLGPDGAWWYGRNQGDNDILHCRRLRSVPDFAPARAC